MYNIINYMSLCKETVKQLEEFVKWEEIGL